MKTAGCLHKPRPRLLLSLLFLPSALALLGCSVMSPPMSPQAQAFKKEVHDIIGKLTPVLAGPLAKDDAQGAQEAILSVYPTAGQREDGFPFRLGALDKNGVVLVTLPQIPGAPGADFSHYQLVKEVLEKKRIATARLYSHGSEPVYAILAPVLVKNQAVGLIGLSLSLYQIEEKWKLTEDEFLHLDLN